MGNVCVCTEEVDNPNQEFAVTQREQNNIVRSPGLEEGVMNTDGSDEPHEDVAEPITDMNDVTDQALMTWEPIAFEPDSTEEYKVFGPYRYKSSGDTYRGGYKLGLRDGIGVLVTKNGSILWGDWFQDELNSGETNYIDKDGNHFIGEGLNTVFNGQAKIKYFNGEVYEGTVSNNLPQGMGQLTTTEGDFYEGEFDKGQMHGYGKLQKFDHSVYEGDFMKGKIHGHGRMEYTDKGMIYVGEWKYGKEHGQGKMDFGHRENKIYEGEFAEGKIRGEGKMLWSNGKEFIGGFWNGKFHGDGKLVDEKGKETIAKWYRGKLKTD